MSGNGSRLDDVGNRHPDLPVPQLPLQNTFEALELEREVGECEMGGPPAMCPGTSEHNNGQNRERTFNNTG